MTTVGVTAGVEAIEPAFPAGAVRVRGSGAFLTALVLVTAITAGLAGLEIALLVTHHEAIPGLLVMFPGGGAVANGATGIRGMADRVDVLGGVLSIDSPPGAGTHVAAEIPCAS
jgi:hypothetical protein